MEQQESGAPGAVPAAAHDEEPGGEGQEQVRHIQYHRPIEKFTSILFPFLVYRGYGITVPCQAILPSTAHPQCKFHPAVKHHDTQRCSVCPATEGGKANSSLMIRHRHVQYHISNLNLNLNSNSNGAFE